RKRLNRVVRERLMSLPPCTDAAGSTLDDFQAIADTVHTSDNGSPSMSRQFFTNSVDVSLDVAFRHLCVRRPDAVKQSIRLENLSRVAHEILQQSELSGSELDLPTIHRCLERSRRNRQAAGLEFI